MIVEFAPIVFEMGISVVEFVAGIRRAILFAALSTNQMLFPAPDVIPATPLLGRGNGESRKDLGSRIELFDDVGR